MYTTANLKVYIVGEVKKDNGESEVIDQFVKFEDLYFNKQKKSIRIPSIRIFLKDYKIESKP